MFYKKYPPPKSLKTLIECFYIWEGFPSTSIELESPPSGLSSIVFNYKKQYEISTSNYKNRIVPKSFVCGQAIKNYTLHIHGEIGMAGIVFKPAGLYHFLGTPMYELTGERVNLKDVLKDKSISPENYIKQKLKHEDKINCMEEFITKLNPDESFSTPEILYAANEIFDNKGIIDLPELIKSTYMSRRKFERKFLTEVGVSPKAYAKIRRFGYTCSLIAGKDKVNLMEVLHKGGYYDQSHFIKDFKYFSGRTPRKYIKTNVELANNVDYIKTVENELQRNLNP